MFQEDTQGNINVGEHGPKWRCVYGSGEVCMGLVWSSVRHPLMFPPTLHIHKFTSSYFKFCQDGNHQEDTDLSSALLTASPNSRRHLGLDTASLLLSWPHGPQAAP